MMKRLNNKGITTIEVLICFVIVIVIAFSLFATISTYNDRRLIEEYKQEVTLYKNLLTQEIQTDLIKIGVVKAEHKRSTSGLEVTHTVDFDMEDGTKRKLVITQRLASSYAANEGREGVSVTPIDDYFMIKYGPPSDMVEHPIPDLGSYKDDNGKTVKDLQINNVSIKISDDNVISIYIGLYHPELGTKYAISIISPINYHFSGGDSFELIQKTMGKVYIKYHVNGGHLAANHGETFTLHNEEIWRSGNPNIQTVGATQSLGVNGLYDINNSSAINVVREGYEPVPNEQWNTMPDGSGISYNDHDSTLIGNSFCDSSEEDCTVTLYAHWQIINYTITYSLNNGVAPGNPTTYTIETDTFTLVNPVREGYTFLGWTGSNGSTPQQEVKIEKGSYGNKTYIANWRINKVNIKLNINQGSLINPHGSSISLYGNAILSNGNEIVHSINYGDQMGSAGLLDYNNSSYLNASRNDYRIISTEEWNSQPDGSGTSFDQRVVYSASSFCDASVTDCEVTLYLNWKTSVFEIRYDLDNGSLTSSNPASYSISSETFTLNNPSKIGYSFIGWTGSNGTYPSTIVTIPKGSTGDRHYTANWEKRKVNIYLNANGGTLASEHGVNYTLNGDKILRSGSEISHEIPYGGQLSENGLLNVNNPSSLNLVRKGYTTVSGREWNTMADGTGRSYDQAEIYSASDFCVDVTYKDCNVTLYANWVGVCGEDNPTVCPIYYVCNDSLTTIHKTATSSRIDMNWNTIPMNENSPSGNPKNIDVHVLGEEGNYYKIYYPISSVPEHLSSERISGDFWYISKNCIQPMQNVACDPACS